MEMGSPVRLQSPASASRGAKKFRPVFEMSRNGGFSWIFLEIKTIEMMKN
jgi:hypothetical protein